MAFLTFPVVICGLFLDYAHVVVVSAYGCVFIFDVSLLRSLVISCAAHGLEVQ